MTLTEIFPTAPAGASFVVPMLRKNHHMVFLHLKNNFEDLFQVVCNAIHTLFCKLGEKLFFRHKIRVVWRTVVLSGSWRFEEPTLDVGCGTQHCPPLSAAGLLQLHIPSQVAGQYSTAGMCYIWSRYCIATSLTQHLFWRWFYFTHGKAPAQPGSCTEALTARTTSGCPRPAQTEGQDTQSTALAPVWLCHHRQHHAHTFITRSFLTMRCSPSQ